MFVFSPVLNVECFCFEYNVWHREIHLCGFLSPLFLKIGGFAFSEMSSSGSTLCSLGAGWKAAGFS